MKILHFIYDHIDNPWVGGGGALRVYEIYSRLAKKGYDITIVSGKYPGVTDYSEGKLKYLFLGNDGNYFLSTFSYTFSAGWYLRQKIDEFDMVIEDFAPWNPLFAYKFQNKRPVVLQLHHKEGREILAKYGLLGLPFYWVEIAYPSRFLYTISVSNETRRKFGVTGVVIENGVNLPLLEEKSLSAGKCSYIIFVGRIDFFNKGLDLLLKSVSKLSVRLIIAGKGRDEKKLERFIKNASNIEYIGFVSEKEKISLIKSSMFVVIPSRFEGQGIIALEAAALGKPVLVSDIVELRYAVENKFGISFKNGDWKDLKNKISWMLENRERLEEMGKKGKCYVQNFTWDKVAVKYENYLLKVFRDFHKC